MYLGCIWGVSGVYLGCVWGVSGWILGGSGMDLGCIWGGFGHAEIRRISTKRLHREMPYVIIRVLCWGNFKAFVEGVKRGPVTPGKRTTKQSGASGRG